VQDREQYLRTAALFLEEPGGALQLTQAEIHPTIGIQLKAHLLKDSEMSKVESARETEEECILTRPTRR